MSACNFCKDEEQSVSDCECDEFKGSRDRFGGIIVHSEKEPCKTTLHLDKKVRASLIKWKCDKVCAAWFKVISADADWIPVLVENGFDYHHAQPGFVMLCKWLDDKASLIPSYAHHYVGVGALVLNKCNEILVIQEKQHKTPMWKLPGGYAEKGEDLDMVAKREVFEETGIEATFLALVAFRHTHQAVHGCSDLYFVCMMNAVTEEIKMCEREILNAKWMKIHEYLECQDVTEGNKAIVHSFLRMHDYDIGIGKNCILGIKPASLYSIDKLTTICQKSSKKSSKC